MISLAVMKRLFFFLFFLNVFLVASAQNTWVQRLSYAFFTAFMHSDSLTGTKYIDISPDGDIYVIGNYGLEEQSRVFKISPTGAPIKWSANVGGHGGLTGYFTHTVHATSDSGCIISGNFWGQSTCHHINGNLVKYSKDGVLEWDYMFGANCATFPFYDNEAFDVIENASGNFYALVGDTLYEFNTSGNIIRRDSSTKGYIIYEIPNGNIIVQEANGIVCKSFGGVAVWNLPSYGLLACTPSYLFCGSSNGISKIDASNGSIVWTKQYPWQIKDLDATTDGGFVASYGYGPGSYCTNCHSTVARVFRVDSVGDTLWSKTYDFPYYGISNVEELNNNIIVGGAFVYTESTTNTDFEYSSFIASLDSAGNGPLQTTSYIRPGNANNNNIIGFTDDAFTTVLSFGKTGSRRDTINYFPFYFNYQCCITDYSTDWFDTSFTGQNLKHADYNGDGIIDTNDIVLYTYRWGGNVNTEPFRLKNQETNSQSIATIYIQPEVDTVSPGDTINFYVIAGSQVQPIDTLCGIAFTGSWQWFPYVIDAIPVELNSDLGTIGLDMYSFMRTREFGNLQTYFLNCRTNNQDVYNVYDTLGYFRIIVSDTMTQTDSIYFMLESSKAIKCNGDTIPLNIVSNSVLFNVSVGTDNVIKNPPKVYPNPVSQTLNVSFSNFGQNTEVKILDATGNLLMTKTVSEKNLQIPIHHLSNGIYFLSIQTSSGIFHKSFAVQH